MNSYTHWLFDLDNTLLDFTKSSKRAFIGLCIEAGYTDDRSHEIFARFSDHTKSLWAAFEKGKISRAYLRIQRFQKTFDDCQMNENATDWSERYVQKVCEEPDVIHRAEPFIRLLRDSGKHLGVITNGIGKVQDKRVRRSPFRDLFDFVLTTDPPFRPKPAEDLFQEALRLWKNPQLEKIVMVGDSFDCDIVGAHKMGIDQCWLHWGQPPTNGLSDDFHPTHSCSNIAELEKLYLTSLGSVSQAPSP